jgi:hypothetical protein
MDNSVVFNLEEKAQDGGEWDYRPGGTRTIKLEIKTAVDQKPLRLRWRDAKRQDDLVCAFVGPHDDFVISWGGGHEPDPPVRTQDRWGAFEEVVPVLAKDEPNFTYFNITHVSAGDLPASVPLVLEAYPDGGGDAVSALSIRLVKPAALPAQVMQIAAAETGQRWLVTAGDSLPEYECRWWSSRTVTYAAVSAPPLTIVREKNELLVQWEGTIVARILDQTKPPVLDRANDVKFDLFHFDALGVDYVALRIWFFWLDKNVKSFAIGGVGRHEIPDAERFDLLLRPGDGLVTLACTDLHWREMWGQTTQPPLQATVGLNWKQKTDLGEEKLGELFHKAGKDGRRDYNPLEYIQFLAHDLAGTAETTVRAKGSAAHVPSLSNVQQVVVDAQRNVLAVTQGTSTEHDMTSSDVRKVKI